MRIGMLAVLLAASLAACRRDEYLRDRDERDAQIVAISVQTEPRGASVRVNRLERTWVTPCDIADFGIRRGTQDLEVSLDGYETISTKVYYDGQRPAAIQLKMRPRAAAVAPVAPAPEEPKPAKPAAVEAPKPAEEPRPAPLKIEAVAGGTRLKITSPGAKVRIQAKTVVSEPERPGEYFLPDVPPDKVVIELVDAKSDALIASVEVAPSGPGAPKGPIPAPKDPVPADAADRVGEVKLVSKTYGVFVKLDPGLSLAPGEEILIVRDGKEIARTKILRVTKGDDKYPDGAAQVQREGPIQKGDEVRRTKP
jgi:hypothetical protein